MQTVPQVRVMPGPPDQVAPSAAMNQQGHAAPGPRTMQTSPRQQGTNAMKQLAIATAAVSGLILFSPSSEARPFGHRGFSGHHHGFHGHRAFGFRHHYGFRGHRGFGRARFGYGRHYGFRGYRGVGFGPARFGYGRHYGRYGYRRGYRGLGLAAGLGFGLAAAAARPAYYGASYGYGYPYAPVGYRYGYGVGRPYCGY